ncbi:MAG TPA: BatA domain-containing protein, partial [Phycisphaerae bacterium]|nr:BatA domain-containing protein [Phycisphaerae bacterium]
MLSVFMMPWLAAFGGIALIIPVLVHLLHRQRVTPIQWGAMQFLLETPLKVRRRRKIDNWLLMLVRMAIVAFLAMLLARPVMRTSNLSSSTPTDVVVVIDHSLT